MLCVLWRGFVAWAMILPWPSNLALRDRPEIERVVSMAQLRREESQECRPLMLDF